MTDKQIKALQQATDDIMEMSKEELLADFGDPGTEYFFAELAKAEKIWGWGMSEIKCPVCGEDASDFEQTGIIECEQCQFMCDIDDFHKIVSAMALREELLWMNECEEVESWLFGKTSAVWEATNLRHCAKAAVLQLMEAMQ